jgi:hypothetical protein
MDAGVKCRFGRFGVTPATYINSSTVRCVTPHIKDDVHDVLTTLVA